jgi:hypothetical protein
MENPQTWGRAEHVVHDVLNERHPSTLRVGLSTARQITDALRRERLLLPDDKGRLADETLGFWLQPDNWDWLVVERPDLVKRLRRALR